ncbi:Uncharacterized protein Fot_09730 [Forsythia ovata]|uniref:Uncharacterized protein n=1 Tax=Forsythia ovata TaxID=205694 RepID=A0ABD1WFI4_9LAMI
MSHTEGPLGDIFNAELEQMPTHEENVVHRRSKGKIVPSRGNRGSSSKGQVLQSSFPFMPTPGVSHPCTDDGMSSGPSICMPTNVVASVITQEVNISSMVDELQQLVAQEVATERAEKARRRRMRNVTGARINNLN